MIDKDYIRDRSILNHTRLTSSEEADSILAQLRDSIKGKITCKDVDRALNERKHPASERKDSEVYLPSGS